MTLDGLRLEDTADGSRDPGQEAVEDLADLVGPAGLAQFRWYQETSLKGKSFMGSVNVTGPGGGNDDAASWSAEITVSGAVTPITVTP